MLLALSANSPFWHGSDTGFASWRGVHSRRWTTYGIPPWFADPDEYDRAVAALMGVGATSDLGAINWAVRLSSRYPTIRGTGVRPRGSTRAGRSRWRSWFVRSSTTVRIAPRPPRPNTSEPWDAAALARGSPWPFQHARPPVAWRARAGDPQGTS